jgi:arylsulfatase A-like enzyme
LLRFVLHRSTHKIKQTKTTKTQTNKHPQQTNKQPQAGTNLGKNQNSLVGSVSVDSQLGAIMDKLDALQITKNTLVIVCQDHGQISKDTMLVEISNT